MGIGSFPGLKRPGRGVDPPPSTAKVEGIHLLPLWAFVACSRVNFTFYQSIHIVVVIVIVDAVVDVAAAVTVNCHINSLHSIYV